MRILHTSDWHLGMPLKLGTMIADQQYFLDQLYSIIEEYDVNAVICAGDIYDSSVTNAEAIELYSSAITKICKELGKKMIDELTKLDETDIMIRFLEEQYHFTPSKDQINLYKEGVKSIGEEADLG